MTALTYLIDIDPEGCADLLASCDLGRLAVIVDGRPEIFPVNHVYDRQSGCVLFPTNARTKLRAALDWPWVAFEVDAVQPDASGGWSVLVVGRAEAVNDPELIGRAARERRVLWAGGEGVQWLRIVPSKVTGRRIWASDDIDLRTR